MSNIVVTTPGSTPVRELRPTEVNQRTPLSAQRSPGASASKLNFGSATKPNQKRLSASPPPFIPASQQHQSVSPMRPAFNTNQHQENIDSCACPTCVWYKSAMVLHHHPNFAQQQGMAMPNMMPNNNAAGMPPMNPQMMAQMMQFMQFMQMQQQMQNFNSQGFPQQQQQHFGGNSNSTTPARSTGGNNNNRNNGTSPSFPRSMSPMANGAASSMSPSPMPNNNNGNNMMPMFPNMMEQQQQMPQSTFSQSQGSSMQHQSPGMNVADALSQFRSAAGHIATVSCTVGGKQMLQAAMRAQRPEVIAAIHTEVIEALESVAVDVNGTHVLRSLIEVLNEQQADELAAKMTEKVLLSVCTTSQHTRKALETLFTRHHGASTNNLQGIVDLVASNALYLSQTQQGCIALMRVFERCNDAQKHSIVEPLLASQKFAALAMDPFGNYVVQCVLINSNPVTRAQYVMEGLRGSFVDLACNKFSSNVLEKVVRHATTNVRAAILDEMLSDEAKLELVAADQFGNFVLQTLVETSVAPDEYDFVSERVKAVLPKTQYARKLEAKMKHAHKIVMAATSGARSASAALAAAATAQSPSPSHRSSASPLPVASDENATE